MAGILTTPKERDFYKEYRGFLHGLMPSLHADLANIVLEYTFPDLKRHLHIRFNIRVMSSDMKILLFSLNYYEHGKTTHAALGINICTIQTSQDISKNMMVSYNCNPLLIDFVKTIYNGTTSKYLEAECMRLYPQIQHWSSEIHDQLTNTISSEFITAAIPTWFTD